MILQSPWFILFAAGLLVVYYLVPGKHQWKVLLAGSVCAYFQVEGARVGFLLTTFLTTLVCGRKIEQARERGERAGGWLAACLGLNLALLLGCKGSLLLPLGISYYTLQALGYVIDVYRGTEKAEKDPGKLALFLCYFPQLIQGPVSRASQLRAPLTEPHAYDGKQVSFGLQRMLWGYFKKLVIADRVAPAVEILTRDQAGGGSFALLAVLYALRIYGDFTGGIDIVLGLSQAFGIGLPENFRQPFFSGSVAEYWRRWHMSLGAWMREYVFFPVSVSKPVRRLGKAARRRLGAFGKRLPVYIATILTWLATGLWHGLTLNFLLWGMLNCLLILIGEELAPLFRGLKGKRWYTGCSILGTWLIMDLIRVCDLFPDPRDYFRGLKSLLTGPWGQIPDLGLSSLDWGILALGCVVMTGVSLVQSRWGSVRELLWKRETLRFWILFALLLAVLLLGCYGVGYEASNFIYNQF